ncbi:MULTISPECIES: hypothetical protein [unclassified Sphingomonas]|uniref:hypothetical protein n=1 Tax=unclassified Sphingomonas TaxID=196159 RepID=UPI002269BC95|nr:MULTISPECIES: hypothetical protein [unclassified Sphingomonas]
MPVRASKTGRWIAAAALCGTAVHANAQVTPAARDAVSTAAPLPKGSDVANPDPSAQLAPAPPLSPADHAALVPQAAPAEPPDPLDEALLAGRRRPGVAQPVLPTRTVQDNPGAIRPPSADAFPTAEFPVPDRWRLVSALCPDKTYVAVQAVCHSPFDPYHQNVLKGDRPIDRAKVPWLPIHGDDWFFVASAISDTVIEPRSFPTPVGVQTTERPGSLDVFGRASSLFLAQTFTASAALIKGSTAFKPPEIEYRLTLAFNVNYAQVNERRILSVLPSAGTTRTDAFLGVQEAFVDYHLRNVSDRYDFDAVRFGIQGFQADFRGFLFNDDEPGIRLFGNRDDNRFQYNLALFGRLEKDTNSGLNDVTQSPRRDYVVIGNLYRQDLPVPGFTSQLIVAYNRNREAGSVHIDFNGFPVRPALLGDLRGRDYDVTYLGYNGDGHFGRINLTASSYLALGQDRNSVFTSRPAEIRAFFLAAEASYDIDWVRVRVSSLYASGDSHPYDNRETGFDAILENPVFAGADTSYWIRQSIPFAGGGRAIGINGRNGVLADLRSSKDEGQSNFNNPGTVLAGAGADFDLTTTVRLATNVNHLWFATTEILQALRSQANVARDIGWDLSAAATWRPRMTQNIVLRLSAAMLVPGGGFTALFAQSGGSGHYYSVLANAIGSF